MIQDERQNYKLSFARNRHYSCLRDSTFTCSRQSWYNEAMSEFIEEVLPGIHRIEVPLPGNPLKAVNSYLIKGEGRYLLIDTGMNREECRSVLTSALRELGVDLERTDFFITHLHVDHLGLAGALATGSSRVYFNQIEARIENASPDEMSRNWRRYQAVFDSNGFPEDELKKAAARHPARLYSGREHISYSIVSEGDEIRIGDYSFRCLETPGHSPGHLCLYEAGKKILISGDHILDDITPNISFWPDMANPLQSYLSNLEKVGKLDVDLVLPGHRRLIKDHRRRIAELKAHHQERLGEALRALGEGEKTAYQVAPLITWDIDLENWEEFPPPQKWFAFGETLIHLHYLEAEGRICRRKKGDLVRFSLA